MRHFFLLLFILIAINSVILSQQTSFTFHNYYIFMEIMPLSDHFQSPFYSIWVKWHINCCIVYQYGMKFPPFLHSHLRLTLLGTPPNRVFFCQKTWFIFLEPPWSYTDCKPFCLTRRTDEQGTGEFRRNK